MILAYEHIRHDVCFVLFCYAAPAEYFQIKTLNEVRSIRPGGRKRGIPPPPYRFTSLIPSPYASMELLESFETCVAEGRIRKPGASNARAKSTRPHQIGTRYAYFTSESLKIAHHSALNNVPYRTRLLRFETFTLSGRMSSRPLTPSETIHTPTQPF